MRALVVGDRRARGALAACRALAAAGWAVGVGSPGGLGLAARSRFVSVRHSVPPPEDDPDAFLHAVALAVSNGGYDVVFGAGDAEVLAMSAMRSSIEAVVPYPQHDVLMRAFDKLSLVDIARRAGIAVPKTTLATGDALAAVNGSVVVKARLHWDPSVAPRVARREALVATGSDDARRRAEEITQHGGQAILQEVVPGSLVAFTTIVDAQRRLVTTVQQRSDHTWPPKAGVSVRAVTVAPDPDLTEGVVRLLADLGWFGLAQLQFVQPSGGTPHLIDLNGRFYGSIALALGAGCNLPAAWAAMAIGGIAADTQPAAVGIRYQWLEGDLRRALRERRGGLGRDVASCLWYALRSKHSIWSTRDPLPAMTYSASLIGRAIEKPLR
jgi:predicted ATP-grasp superfamily ATP-dependent carboligase